MIEQFLLKIGMRCGTVKNFNTVINDDIKREDGQHWYFLTPIKNSDKGNGLKECTVNMAYPFEAAKDEVTEQAAIERISEFIEPYQSELLKNLKKTVLVPSYTFSVIPFWANEKGERNERRDFGSSRIHIINAQVTILYRENWFKN